MKLFVLALVIVAVAVGGCGRKKTQITTDLTSDATAGQSTGPETTTGAGLPNLEQEKLFFQQLAEAGTVYFAYDSSQLDPTAMETLKRNAEIIKQMPNSVIQIEGHCDERGTEEYNRALGDRRALSAREEIVAAGIDPSRIITVSYGEDRPAVPQSTPEAWAKNRRAEFILLTEP